MTTVSYHSVLESHTLSALIKYELTTYVRIRFNAIERVNTPTHTAGTLDYAYLPYIEIKTQYVNGSVIVAFSKETQRNVSMNTFYTSTWTNRPGDPE